ncbi:hypothetical protein G3I24_31115 [Micromonospora aurantiaca]|nr:hypothetical protein [Micromonospora aurantiaca]
MPDVGVYTTLKLLRRPHPSDGFDMLFTVVPTTDGDFDIREMTDEEP